MIRQVAEERNSTQEFNLVFTNFHATLFNTAFVVFFANNSKRTIRGSYNSESSSLIFRF